MKIFSPSINGDAQVTGSLLVTGTITGTVTTSSYAVTASYALNGGGSVDTSALATTGSNSFNGSQIITGSLTITQNLIVLGSSSITYVSSSQLNIGTNKITVNTLAPAVRFGGISVQDSGSFATGSLWWDSIANTWIYQHEEGASYTSGMLMSGPRNTGSLGSESGLTSGRIPRSQGYDHLEDSNITDSNSIVSINSDTQITGSLIVTQGITGSLFGTASYALSSAGGSTTSGPTLGQALALFSGFSTH